MEIGKAAYPASTRFYVGGDDGIHISSSAKVGGFLYAYPGKIHINQSVDIFGGLFGNDVHINGFTNIHYDRNVQRSGRVCELIPDPTDPTDPTDPDPGPQCISLDGSCDVDGDCCAPLVCFQGTCTTARCADPFETCVETSDCCSGVCARAAGDPSGICIIQ